LTIPEPVWRSMGSNRGLPNRKRFHDFMGAFSRYPFSSITITHRSMLNTSIPHNLSHLPRDSVLTKCATFVIKK
jgi:hypothetical protein